MGVNDALVRLDLNNPVFQETPLQPAKSRTPRGDRHIEKGAATHLSTGLSRQRLEMGKIVSIKPPAGIVAVYSLRITQSRRATASVGWATG